MHIKRLLVLLFTAVLLLSSCQGDGGATQAPTEAATEAATPPVAEVTTAPVTEISTAPVTDPPAEPATESSAEAPTEVPTEPPTEPVSETIPRASLYFTREEYPRIDGATAMYPMSVEIARAVMAISEEEAESLITHHTTANAYDNLIQKECDLIFVSEPSNDILRRAREAGVSFEMAGIGRDAFVFIVNQANPVEDLSIDEIQKIYMGEITNWQEVGGADSPITAYQREANSGSQNLMEKMVMQGKDMMNTAPEYEIRSMAGLVDVIADYQNVESALGYSIYLYAKEQYVRDSIKFLSVNGVYPTDETIADGSYPLSKIVYAVFREDEPEGSPVRQLVDWIKSPEGQEAVMRGGYVGMQGEHTRITSRESSELTWLRTVDFEVQIDESRGEVNSRLLLENTGEMTVRGTLSLPLFSGGMKKNSLKLEKKGEGEASPGSLEEVLLTLPPGESLLLTYSYESGRDLAQASLIGFDLRSLCFRDGAGIGRVSFSILMAEEDLPLVKDIRPINWTLDKQTLSLKLYDVAPSPLLDRIYVEKETYRNLKSQTFMKYEYEQETGSVLVEEETPELVKTILSSYRRWFQEGIGDESFPRDVELLFAKMCGYDISKTQDMFPPWYGDYQSLSYYENQGYKNLVVYLILREMGKQSLDQKSAFSMCAGLLQGSNHRKNAAIWPVNRELIRQMLFPEELQLICVCTAREPSLAGVDLYEAKDPEFGGGELRPVKEEDLLLMVPGLYSLACCEPSFTAWRADVMGEITGTDPEVFRTYLRGSEIQLLVQMRVLNSLESDEEWEWKYQTLAFLEEGNLGREDLEHEYVTIMPAVRDDFLAQMDVPLLIHYSAEVIKGKDGHAIVQANDDNYLSSQGLTLYSCLLASEKAEEMGQRSREENLDRRREIDEYIRQLINP